MAKATKTAKKSRPSLTPEAKESRLIALAMDAVEERILNGEATSQELVHFLKLGSSKNRAEMEKLQGENELLRAKTESIESSKDIQKLFSEAISAFKGYQGEAEVRDEFNEEDIYD